MNQKIRMSQLLLAILVMAHVSLVHAQDPSPAQNPNVKSYPVVRQETYTQVLDIVFPRESIDPPVNVFTFVLRMSPYSEPESQITIKRNVEGIEVIEYKAVDKGIYTRINELLANGAREDPKELASAIRVTRRVVRVPPAQVARWYTGFFNSLTRTVNVLRTKGQEFERSGTQTIFLHGTVYNLWYEQGLNEMSFSLYDVDPIHVRSGTEFKLVQWIELVRKDIQRIK